MLAFLRGTLAAVEKEAIIVEVNGIGFQLQVPASTLERLPGLGAEVKLHTYLASREDGVSLYGFWGQEELAVFRALLGVGGVGPKAAIGLLSALGPHRLHLAIAKGEADALTRAPGVGRKTAQRIILELKDKLAREIAPIDPSVKKVSGEEEDAVQALVALGYHESEARKAVRTTLAEAGGAPLQAAQLVRLALKRLAR
ncbi:MAG: Holliday junction branch migration protein RuvA [Bacillota bacterium]